MFLSLTPMFCCCFCGSERAVYCHRGHVASGLAPALQQEPQTLVFLAAPAALHGLPPVALLSELLSAGQESRGVQPESDEREEPACSGQPDLHQPAELWVQWLASVEVWPVLQDLHAEDPAADARVHAEPRQVRAHADLYIPESTRTSQRRLFDVCIHICKTVCSSAMRL